VIGADIARREEYEAWLFANPDQRTHAAGHRWEHEHMYGLLGLPPEEISPLGHQSIKWVSDPDVEDGYQPAEQYREINSGAVWSREYGWHLSLLDANCNARPDVEGYRCTPPIAYYCQCWLDQQMIGPITDMWQDNEDAWVRKAVDERERADTLRKQTPFAWLVYVLTHREALDRPVYWPELALCNEWCKPDKEGWCYWRWLERHKPLPPDERVSTLFLSRRKYKPKDKPHALAGNKAEDIAGHCCSNHECNSCLGIGTPKWRPVSCGNSVKNCQCLEDWRPFITWRPWENPPTKIMQEWEEFWGLCVQYKVRHVPLEGKLKNVLWEHRGTAPFLPYNDKHRLHWYARVPSNRRRFQLRSWVNGLPRPHQYAKAWECFDTGYKANLDYTIVNREHPPEKKTPGYKLHVSWRVIMEHTGCSRATAFRRIAEGWSLADCECPVCRPLPVLNPC
jgi:hypothetical protein